MVELTKTQLAGIVALTAFIAGIGGNAVQFDPAKTYYCDSRDMVVQCLRLSSTGISCYYNDDFGKETYFKCSEGWEPINKYVAFNGSQKPSEDLDSLPCSEYAYKAVCRI